MKQAISTQQLEDAYDAYGTAVYRLAMAFLGQCADAEDVTQETFCRLLYRAPIFTDENHQKRWLLQVAANLCRNQLRGFWRKRVTQLEDTIPVIVRELDDDAAVIMMVDSNLQRENILPSERAKAYKMKMDALSAQGMEQIMAALMGGDAGEGHRYRA